MASSATEEQRQQQALQLRQQYNSAQTEAEKQAVLQRVDPKQHDEFKRFCAQPDNAGTTAAPAKPVDSSFHSTSRIQTREPEVLANLECFTEPNETQAIVTALLLWLISGSEEQQSAAKKILGEINAAEVIKDTTKCAELVAKFDHKKFDEQVVLNQKSAEEKRQLLQLRKIDKKVYPVVTEKAFVSANELRENLVKSSPIPLSVSTSISFKVLMGEENKDNVLKSLRTQFLLDGKTARDESVKSAEIIGDCLLVEFKDDASLRFSISENGCIEALYQAKDLDTKNKDSVFKAFEIMAKKFYAMFLEAELAQDKSAQPENFDITLSLKKADLAGASAEDIAKKFHENGFAKVCVKLDENSEIFEAKEPKSLAPKKPESPIAQQVALKKFQADLKKQVGEAPAPSDAIKRYVEKPQELAVYAPPKPLPPTKLEWFNQLRPLVLSYLSPPDLRASQAEIAKLAAQPGLSEAERSQKLIKILEPAYIQLAKQTMCVGFAKNVIKWPLTYFGSLPIAYVTAGGAFSVQALGLVLNAAVTEASERYWVSMVMDSGFGVKCPPTESLKKRALTHVLPGVAATYFAGMNPFYSGVYTMIFQGVASAASTYLPLVYVDAKLGKYGPVSKGTLGLAEWGLGLFGRGVAKGVEVTQDLKGSLMYMG